MVNNSLYVVLILAAVDIKRFFICFISDPIPHFTTEHHLTAFHIVVHYVLQFRH